MLICSMPECQTTAGCKCSERVWPEVTALQVRKLDDLVRPEFERGEWETLESEAIDARAMMEAIAWDIGKELVAYIEVMYPKAIDATSSTFKLSMRNHIHNDIMAAFEFRGDAVALASRLKDRKEFRRQWVAAYRKIRAAR